MTVRCSNWTGGMQQGHHAEAEPPTPSTSATAAIRAAIQLRISLPSKKTPCPRTTKLATLGNIGKVGATFTIKNLLTVGGTEGRTQSRKGVRETPEEKFKGPGKVCPKNWAPAIIPSPGEEMT